MALIMFLAYNPGLLKRSFSPTNALPEKPISDISSGKHFAITDISSSDSSNSAFLPFSILSYGGNYAFQSFGYCDNFSDERSSSEIAFAAV